MSNETYTQGDWFQGECFSFCDKHHQHDFINCNYVGLSFRNPISHNVCIQKSSTDVFCLIGSDENGVILQNHKDAQLIAAAPSMLTTLCHYAALEELNGVFDSFAHKAIIKATHGHDKSQ